MPTEETTTSVEANVDEEQEDAPLVQKSRRSRENKNRNMGMLSPIPEETSDNSSSEFVRAECLGICISNRGMSNSAVQRMWEGEILDCCEDEWVALETSCCPCMTFGHNMSTAGFGSLACQATTYFLLTGGVFTTCQLVAIYTSSVFFWWLSFVLFFIGTGYGAYYRMELRRKFNIYGDDSLDYFIHGCCSWCALCQEARTLRTNVSQGIWSARGSQLTTVGQPLPLQDIPPLAHKMSFSLQSKDSSIELQPNVAPNIPEMSATIAPSL